MSQKDSRPKEPQYGEDMENRLLPLKKCNAVIRVIGILSLLCLLSACFPKTYIQQGTESLPPEEKVKVFASGVIHFYSIDKEKIKISGDPMTHADTTLYLTPGFHLFEVGFRSATARSRGTVGLGEKLLPGKTYRIETGVDRHSFRPFIREILNDAEKNPRMWQ